MDSERVEEAVELAEHSGAVGMSQEQYQQLCQMLLQKAGFIKLTHGVYDQAQDYFLRGSVDVREVSCTYLSKRGPFSACHNNSEAIYIMWGA